MLGKTIIHCKIIEKLGEGGTCPVGPMFKLEVI